MLPRKCTRLIWLPSTSYYFIWSTPAFFRGLREGMKLLCWTWLWWSCLTIVDLSIFLAQWFSTWQELQILPNPSMLYHMVLCWLSCLTSSTLPYLSLSLETTMMFWMLLPSSSVDMSRSRLEDPQDLLFFLGAVGLQNLARYWSWLLKRMTSFVKTIMSWERKQSNSGKSLEETGRLMLNRLLPLWKPLPHLLLTHEHVPSQCPLFFCYSSDALSFVLFVLVWVVCSMLSLFCSNDEDKALGFFWHYLMSHIALLYCFVLYWIINLVYFPFLKLVL